MANKIFTNKSVFAWIFIAVVFLLLKVYSLSTKNKYRKSILAAPSFTSGKIYDLKTSRSGLVASYTYDIKGRFYYSKHMDGRYDHLGIEILKHYFPVIYNEKHPEKNQILVFPNDFESFNLPFPDSLKWVTGFNN